MIGESNSKAAKLPCETINITLLTNQPSHEDIMGLSVNVSYEGFSKDYAWEGKEITVKVPADMQYTVAFSEAQGYKTPESVSYKAVEDNARDIEALYQTEAVTVNVADGEGSAISADVMVDGVAYSGSSVTHKVPYGKTYQVVGGALDGYVQPSAMEFTAENPSREVSLIYIASSLTVGILSNQAADAVIGAVKATVSYGGISVEVMNGQTITIPTDKEVTISFPEVEGYLAPEDIVFTNSEGGNVEKSGTYQTELLTVNVTADKGTPEGFEITIGKVETVGVAEKYTRLEYIEANGSQYTDTGLVVNKSDNYKMEIVALFTNDAYGGCNGYMQFKSGIALNKKSTITVEYNSNIEKIYVDGALNSTDDWTTRYSETNVKLGLFKLGNPNNSWYDGEAQEGQLYSCKIYDNGALVRDYIPALRSDGIAGLYDAVNDTFTASSGIGNFVAGGDSSEVIATQTSVTGTYKIPYGVDYVVKASEVGSYMTPDLYRKTADTPTNVVSMRYVYTTDPGITNPTNGVWIQSTDGKYYTEDNWDGSKVADCVAVVTSSCRFGIALTEASSTMPIHSSYDGALENYMTAISDLTQAMADYDGAKNTANIMKIQSGIGYAAGWCNAYTFPSGKKGFLPSLGQWRAAFDNKAAVDAALIKAGGTAITLAEYWTSTLRGVYSDGRRGCWILTWDGGFMGHYYLDHSDCRVRAFKSL